MKLKNKILTFFFFFFILLKINARTENVLDYYKDLIKSGLPLYVRDIDAIKKEAEQFSSIPSYKKPDILIDLKNEYVQIIEYPDQGYFPITTEIALFYGSAGSDFLAVSHYGASGDPLGRKGQKSFNVYEYKNKTWIDATERIIPVIDYKIFFKNENTAGSKEFLKIIGEAELFYYLPLKGTSITVEFNLSNAEKYFGSFMEAELGINKPQFDAIIKDIKIREVYLNWNYKKNIFDLNYTK